MIELIAVFLICLIVFNSISQRLTSFIQIILTEVNFAEEKVCISGSWISLHSSKKFGLRLRKKSVFKQLFTFSKKLITALSS